MPSMFEQLAAKGGIPKGVETAMLDFARAMFAETKNITEKLSSDRTLLGALSVCHEVELVFNGLIPPTFHEVGVDTRDKDHMHKVLSWHSDLTERMVHHAAQLHGDLFELVQVLLLDTPEDLLKLLNENTAKKEATSGTEEPKHEDGAAPVQTQPSHGNEGEAGPRG